MRLGRILLPTLYLTLTLAASAQWPQWRGPDANSISTARDIPVTWSETDNVHWKTPLPGVGTSTPILIDGQVVLTMHIGANPLASPLASLIFEKGIFEGQYLRKWIKGLLQNRGVRTFKDLIIEDQKGSESYSFKLRLIASDISRGRMLVLPQDIADFGLRP